MNKKTLFSQDMVVLNELGMHARPAAVIARMTENATGNIWLTHGSARVDASSIIDLLTLCAVKGSHVVVQVESVEDKGVMAQIKEFFDIGFGELNNE